MLLAWLTFYGSALASVRARPHRLPGAGRPGAAAPRRALGIVAQMLVIAFFVLLGWVGASILPIIAGDALVSVPAVSMACRAVGDPDLVRADRDRRDRSAGRAAADGGAGRPAGAGAFRRTALRAAR